MVQQWAKCIQGIVFRFDSQYMFSLRAAALLYFGVNDYPNRRHPFSLALANIALELISHSRNLDMSNDDGGTALMFASAGGYEEVVQKLLANGATVNIKDNVGKTALDYANEERELEIARLLKTSSGVS